MDQNKGREKEYFDRFGREAGYDNLTEGSYQKLLGHFRRLAEPRAGETIVDLGCGSGAFAARLRREFPGTTILGIDISSECIAAASRANPDIRFIAGDIEATRLEPESVDIACFFGVLHHFPDFRTAAREAFRILKPGGRFFSYDPHLYSPPHWLYRCCPLSPFRSIGVTPNERLLTRGEVAEVFSQAGFEAEAMIDGGVIARWHVNPLVHYVVQPIYNVGELALAMTPLARFIGSAVIGWGKRR